MLLFMPRAEGMPKVPTPIPFFAFCILQQDLEKIPELLTEILKSRIKVDNTLDQLKQSKSDEAKQCLVLDEIKSFFVDFPCAFTQSAILSKVPEELEGEGRLPDEAS